MSEKVYDCLCAGIIVADYVCDPVDHLPAAGELVLSGRMHLTIGGCASNAAVYLAKLGRTAAVAGTVGKDVFGRYVRENLEARGVNCEHVVESPTEQTSGTMVINTRGEDRRFIHAIGANDEFTGSEISEKLIRSTKVLYLGGYCLMDSLSPENVAALFQKAKQAGATTVLDVVIPQPGDYWPQLRPVLPLTDLFCPNDDESRIIAGTDDPREQAETFREAGAKTVAVTCGERGAVVVSETERFRSGCFPVEFVDGTGSGDAFTAGFIHGLLKGGNLQECTRYGAALGAGSVQSPGATAGAMTAEELESYVSAKELTIQDF